MALDKGAAGMIFIVGNSRSGTTMLGRILGRNPVVHTFNELHFFEHQVDGKTIRTRPPWPKAKAMALLERLLTSARKGFFAPRRKGEFARDAEKIIARAAAPDPLALYESFLHFETRAQGKRIPCEQTPRYLFYVSDILAAFPQARVITLTRDPRDVLISQKYKWKRRFLGGKAIPRREALRAWVNYHPVLTTRLWVASARQVAALAGEERVLSLRFEDLLAAPESSMRRVCAFLGLDYAPEMLNVPQVGSSSGASAPQKRGINPARAQSWQKAGGGLSRAELCGCEWLAGAEMRRNGYPLAGNGRFSLRLLPGLGLLALKLVLALPMNLSRTKNLRETLRRRLFVAKGG